MILGLDLSITSTGWAVLDKKSKRIINWGKICTQPKDFNTEDIRINYIVDKISKIIEDNKVTDIALENQFIGTRSPAIMVLRKLLGAVCRMSYYEYGTKINYYSPTTIKKCITGKGNSKKDLVAETIKDNYINIGNYSDTGKNKTSDIYDAIGVAITHMKG